MDGQDLSAFNQLATNFGLGVAVLIAVIVAIAWGKLRLEREVVKLEEENKTLKEQNGRLAEANKTISEAAREAALGFNRALEKFDELRATSRGR